MKKNLFLMTFSILSLTNCSPDSKDKQVSDSNTKIMNNSEIIEHVKLAINPKYQDWVLFKNGTYIIFDHADTITNVNEEAIKQMKEFGPVFAGGPAGDFNTIHLTKTDGWIVSGHGYGMYTYVNPSEIKNKTPNDLEVGLFGRSKRDLDGKNPEILYTNNRKK
ncbi:hypothetical protein CLU96_3158 [Chryseobacterium sp. 52]|uniref:hypothetical protein n=1 Tax=Chryseobacterium sp. 52 TaxID=2035213 RepID=UPI000C18F470|nr:hypothetical protein [Chryseobacterium sp. 52]PIF46139.1 hypothetical protein CLU96_3158 [Chryseobacterium sp. 52]